MLSVPLWQGHGAVVCAQTLGSARSCGSVHKCHPGLEVTQPTSSVALRFHLAPSHCAPCPIPALCRSAPSLLGAVTSQGSLCVPALGRHSLGAPREHGAASTIPWEQHGGHRGLPSSVECEESPQDVLSLTGQCEAFIRSG